MFLHTSSILGGSEKSFLDYFSRLKAESKAECLVVLPDSGPLNDQLRNLNAKIEIIKFPKQFLKITRKKPLLAILNTLMSLPWLFTYYLHLEKTLRAGSYQCVYSNGIKCHIISLFLKSRNKIKLIWHLQDFFPKNFYLKIFISFFSNLPERAVCNSDAVKNDFFLNQKISTITVHNAVDLKQFQFQKNKTNKSKIIIAMVGMLTPWKGQHIFLEAAKIISKKYSNVIFKIVGDEVYKTSGEVGYKQKLKEHINKENLNQIVSLQGFVSHIENIYHEADIFVHASIKPEPFGKVIVEAMACGKPVIATNGGGVPEIIKNNENGLLVEMGNAIAMAQAMEVLIVSPELREKYGENARKHVEKNFSAENYFFKIKEVIETL